MIRFALAGAAVLATLGATVLPVSAAVAEKRGGDVLRLRGRLSTGQNIFPQPSGKADYRERTNELRFSVEVEDMAPNTTFDILHNGSVIGQVTTDGLGFADFNVSSNTDDPGEQGDVPAMSAGDVISVGPVSGGLFVKR